MATKRKKKQPAGYTVGLRIARNVRTQLYALDNRAGNERPVGDGVTAKIAKNVGRWLGQRPSKNHHLDHILPLSWWDCRDDNQLKLCWSTKNLRWLYGPTNSGRGNRMSRTEYDSLTAWHYKAMQQAKYLPDYVREWNRQRVKTSSGRKKSSIR